MNHIKICMGLFLWLSIVALINWVCISFWILPWQAQDQYETVSCQVVSCNVKLNLDSWTITLGYQWQQYNPKYIVYTEKENWCSMNMTSLTCYYNDVDPSSFDLSLDNIHTQSAEGAILALVFINLCIFLAPIIWFFESNTCSHES